MEKIYDELKSTNSTNQKISILRNITHDGIKKCLALCYDPMMQFNIKKFNPDFDMSARYTFENSYVEFIELLIKLNKRIYTGNVAKSAVETFLSKCKPNTQHLYSLLLKKDLKVGISTKTLNSAFGKNFINVFSVQLANEYIPTKKYNVDYWWASPKLDGIRSYGMMDSLYSRSGHLQKGFDHIIDELNILIDTYELNFVDGELFTDSVDFEDIQAAVGATKNIDKDKKELIYYNIFAVGHNNIRITDDMIDIINNIDWNKFRYLRPVEYMKVNNTPDDILSACKYYTSLGFEGVMLRHNINWYVNKRSNDLLKYKLFKENDFKCIGFMPGNVGTKFEHTLGVIIVEGVDIIRDDDGNVIMEKPVRSEVSGFTDEMRDEIWNNKSFYLNKMVEVKYQNSTSKQDVETGKFALRFASFNKWKLV